MDWTAIAADCASSLGRVCLGVAAAAAAGLAFGLLRSALPAFCKRSRILRFLVEAPQFPPPIAWIPVVIILFGIGNLAAAVVVFIGAFPPIFTSVYYGAESIPAPIAATARSLGFRGLRYHARILLPFVLPHFFSGLRAGTGMGWMAVIAAEMVSGQSGLGYSIQLNRLHLQYEALALDMVLIGGLGYGLFRLVDLMEQIFIPWHERRRQVA